MTVSAESLAARSTRSCIGVGVAHEACSAGIIVPGSFRPAHESTWMRAWIGALDAIGVHMACHARRVGSFRTMAGGAAFDITSRHEGVLSAAAANPECREHRVIMVCGLEHELVDVPASPMTLDTGLFL